jgi:hypothetical protein
MSKQLTRKERIAAEIKKTEDLLKRNGFVRNRKGRKLDSKLPDLACPGYFEDRTLLEVCVGDKTTGNKNDIITNMYKFDQKTQEAIKDKMTRIAPAYNKGGLQYLGTGKENWKDAGKKNAS